MTSDGGAAVVIEIGRTWDGEPAPRHEIARIVLRGRPGGLVVEVEAPFHGDPPPAGPPGPTPGLWEHEVVELFVAGGGATRYLELELSPHGHSLVLELDGIRRPTDSRPTVAYEAHREGGRWWGRAIVGRELLPIGPHFAAAFAMHGHGAERRYLSSIALPGDVPDFHQPGCFPPIVLPGVGRG